jgi:hypothetical protein
MLTVGILINECHYAICCYVECHYADCCYVECRGTSDFRVRKYICPARIKELSQCETHFRTLL